MAKKKTEDDLLLDMPVSFGGCSFGGKTARLGIVVDREFLKLPEADKKLCDLRLTGTIIARPVGDQEGQQRLAGMEADLFMDGIFDVKGFSVSTGSIHFGLTFSIKNLNRGMLSEFAKREGRLQVKGTEAIPEAERGADTNGEEGGEE